MQPSNSRRGEITRDIHGIVLIPKSLFFIKKRRFESQGLVAVIVFFFDVGFGVEKSWAEGSALMDAFLHSQEGVGRKGTDGVSTGKGLAGVSVRR